MKNTSAYIGLAVTASHCVGTECNLESGPH